MRVHYNSWELMRIAIPQKVSKIVARILGIDVSLVYMWRREPESDDNPTGTGYPSPHDAEKELIDAVDDTNPDGADLLIADLKAHLESKRAKQSSEPLSQAELLAKMAHENSDALVAYATNMAPDVIEKEALEAIAVLQSLVTRVRKIKKVGGRKP